MLAVAVSSVSASRYGTWNCSRMRPATSSAATIACLEEPSVPQGEIRQQDEELVSPQACDRVGLPRNLIQALPRLHQELVPRSVPEPIVHQLEVVHVEVQHGHRAVASLSPGQRLVEVLLEQGPVGEPGHLVVIREVSGQVLPRLRSVMSLAMLETPRTTPARSVMGESVRDTSISAPSFRRRTTSRCGRARSRAPSEQSGPPPGGRAGIRSDRAPPTRGTRRSAPRRGSSSG